jgi:hypothetical protein
VQRAARTHSFALRACLPRNSLLPAALLCVSLLTIAHFQNESNAWCKSPPTLFLWMVRELLIKNKRDLYDD